MNSIDFLPSRIRLQRRRRVHLKRQAVLLGICCACLSGLAYANQGRINQARAELVTRQNCHQKMEDQLNMVQTLTLQQADLEIKSRISRELGSRTDLNAVLAELSRLLPKSAGLTSLDCSTIETEAHAPINDSNTAVPAGEGKMVRSGPETRVKLIITGLAANDLDVANFIGQLSASPLFEDVNMGYAKTVDVKNQNRKARDFQVSCLLVR